MCEGSLPKGGGGAWGGGGVGVKLRTHQKEITFKIFTCWVKQTEILMCYTGYSAMLCVKIIVLGKFFKVMCINFG